MNENRNLGLRNAFRSVSGRALKKILPKLLRAYEKANDLIPAYGYELDPKGQIIDQYRGFKGGARLCVLAKDSKGDLYFLLLSEKKFHRDYVQWNLIEGMRNGPDINLEPSDIKTQANQPFPNDAGLCLSDQHTAVQDALEDIGLDLKAMNIIPKRVHLRTADGMQHGPIGAAGNFVLQDVTTYRVFFDECPDLSISTKERGVRNVEWIKLKDCLSMSNTGNIEQGQDGFEKAVKFLDIRGDEHFFDAHQARSILDSVRDQMLDELSTKRPNLPIRQYEQIKHHCPDRFEDMIAWHEASLRVPQQTFDKHPS